MEIANIQIQPQKKMHWVVNIITIKHGTVSYVNY